MSNELAVMPTANDLALLKQIGKIAIQSKFLPDSIRTVEQAIVILLKGRELGVPPMSSFSSISVINGKPTLSAELMLALIYKKCPKAQIVFVKTTAVICEIKARRSAELDFAFFSFTIEDAQGANLLNKISWKSYPKAMLRARCISSVARAVFPDCILGSYTSEEMGEEVSSEDVIDVESTSVASVENKHTEKKEETCEDLIRQIGALMLLIKDNDDVLADKIEDDLALHIDDKIYLKKMVLRINQILADQTAKEEGTNE